MMDDGDVIVHSLKHGKYLQVHTILCVTHLHQLVGIHRVLPLPVSGGVGPAVHLPVSFYDHGDITAVLGVLNIKSSDNNN